MQQEHVRIKIDEIPRTDRRRLKRDCFDGLLMNRIRQPILQSLPLDKLSGRKTFEKSGEFVKLKQNACFSKTYFSCYTMITNFFIFSLKH